MRNERITEQLRRNAVALISLAIAITSLGYNTWRNEHSEFNRNQRQASFQILEKLGELQQLVFLNHYDCNFTLRGNARTGWTIVQTIEDLTLVLKDLPRNSAAELKEAWDSNWRDLDYPGTDACMNRSEERRGLGIAAKDAVEAAREQVRQDVLGILRSLE